ncbi:MAG: LLM class flavin-dependent oxidoreductase [Mycetocola sp.]
MTALLTLLLLPTAAHPSASNPGVSPVASYSDWRDRARTAERAGIDALFIADSPGIWAATDQPRAFDPVSLLSALARDTSSIGLIGTSSTSFNEPYTVARQYASLHQISDGRAGWNSVGTSDARAAENFNSTGWDDHARRYRVGHEFTGVVRELWRAGRTPIGHDGEFFRVRGPLDVPLDADNQPIITQAGGSEAGLQLAAAYANATFGNLASHRAALEFRARLREAEAAHGRTAPNHVRLLPGVVPYLADSEDEARAYKASLDAAVDLRPLIPTVARFLHLPVETLEQLEEDAPFPVSLLADPATVTNSVATYAALYEVVHSTRPTTAQLLLKAGGAARHREFVGTPQSFADHLEHWVSTDAADGFMLMLPSYGRDLDYFADAVAPVLRERGLVSPLGDPRSLSERFGATHPA